MERGLFFVPTPKVIDKPLLERALHLFFRSMRIHKFFSDSDSPAAAPFSLPSLWEPQANQTSEVLHQFISESKEAFFNLAVGHFPKSNLSKQESIALKHLRNNEDIVIKPADKDNYIFEATRQASNIMHYTPHRNPSF